MREGSSRGGIWAGPRRMQNIVLHVGCCSTLAGIYVTAARHSQRAAMLCVHELACCSMPPLGLSFDQWALCSQPRPAWPAWQTVPPTAPPPLFCTEPCPAALSPAHKQPLAALLTPLPLLHPRCAGPAPPKIRSDCAQPAPAVASRWVQSHAGPAAGH